MIWNFLFLEMHSRENTGHTVIKYKILLAETSTLYNLSF